MYLKINKENFRHFEDHSASSGIPERRPFVWLVTPDEGPSPETSKFSFIYIFR
jgi:hypothetical protein